MDHMGSIGTPKGHHQKNYILISFRSRSWKDFLYVCMYVYMYVSMYVYMYACMYVCIYVCVLTLYRSQFSSDYHTGSLGQK